MKNRIINNNQHGREGEETAVAYLKAQGFEILERNWRFRRYEVDIIARKKDLLAIIEVKTRKSNTFGEPEIFVSLKKQNFLIAAAHQYIIERDMDCECRFDIVAITQLNNNPTVKHFEGAFYPRAR